MYFISVKGCQDPALASTFVVERKSKRAQVRCRSSGDAWTLRCDGSNWVGSIGNCSLCKILSIINLIVNILIFYVIKVYDTCVLCHFVTFTTIILLISTNIRFVFHFRSSKSNRNTWYLGFFAIYRYALVISWNDINMLVKQAALLKIY